MDTEEDVEPFALLSNKVGSIKSWLDSNKKRGLPPYEWVIPNVLPAGVGLLQAGGGVGKTFVSLSFAIHAAIGRSFQGVKSKPIKTLVILGEDTEKDLLYRMTAVTETLNYPYDNLDENIDFSIMPACKLLKQNGKTWGLTNSAKALVELVKQLKFQFVIIDNLYALSGADPNESTAMSELLDLLFLLDKTMLETINNQKTCVLMVHHFNKTQASKFVQQGAERGSGSGVIGNRARFVLNADRVLKKERELLELNDDGRDYVSVKLVKSNRHGTGVKHVFKGTHVEKYNAFCYVWNKTVYREDEEENELDKKEVLRKLKGLGLNKPLAISTLAKKLNDLGIGTRKDIELSLEELIADGSINKNQQGKVLVNN